METRGSFDSLSGVRSGQLIGGKYLLLEPLGAGGMAQVWAARNLATDAEVAIKLLHTGGTAPDMVARFRREAHATGRLNHRSIVRIFDLVEDEEADGCLAMVMERFRGRTLARVLQEKKLLSIDQTLRILLPILSGLEHAHYFGIIHRDLKPENIFLAVESEGEVIPKLLDFGVSKMLLDGNAPITGCGEIVGTPYHMSPEQLRGGPIDARSDVFCAGIVLYMCLTGRHPFVASQTMRAVVAVLEEDPIPADHLPSSLWYVIRRSLEKDPRDRFASAAELAEALLQCVGHGTTPERKSSDDIPTLTGTLIVPERTGRKALGLAIAACVAGVWFGGIQAHGAATVRERSERWTMRAHSGPRRLVGSVDVLVTPAASVASARLASARGFVAVDGRDAELAARGF